MSGFITLAEGSGGKEMQDLITAFKFPHGPWRGCDDDAAFFDLGDGRLLVFTTDSFVVTPLFFPGGDIGTLACCGTINDLAVMGATPLGLSLALIVEEGFPKKELDTVVASIRRVAEESGIPIATGDTKVMEKGKVDGIVITTAGVGIAAKDELLTRTVAPGDKVILSGGIGEHAVALLSKRFEYTTAIVTDSKPLTEEIAAVRSLINAAKDPTRGGIAACLNELCLKHGVGMRIEEEMIPAKSEVRTVTEMLGINLYELACEGRFVCIAPAQHAAAVVGKLRAFNADAAIIGEVTAGNTVIMETFLGKRILPMPRGRIVPRIC